MTRKSAGSKKKESSSKRKQKSGKHVSPLTAQQPGENDAKKKNHNKKSAKRVRQEHEEDVEEAALTQLLFGNTTASGSSRGASSTMTKLPTESSWFQLDRQADEDSVNNEAGDNEEDDASSHDDQLPPLPKRNATDIPAAAAWQDEDDEADATTVSLVQSSTSHRLRKLRTSRSETDPLTAVEFESRLRQRYQASSGQLARTDWAQQALQRRQQEQNSKAKDDDENDIVSQFMATSQPLLNQHGGTSVLPPHILNIVRCPDVNRSDPSSAVIQAVQFHPGSDPDQPLVLTAGLDKTLRFFHITNDDNSNSNKTTTTIRSDKVHGIHFPKLPIYSASFLGTTGNVVVSGRRPFYYIYNAITGTVDWIPNVGGGSHHADTKSWERHVVSSDGKWIAFLGNDGYIVLVDAHSKQMMGDFKMNGSVRTVVFTKDNQELLASGSDGDIYRFDVNSRRCIERFSNQDGTITSALAASSRYLAVGAESGVVNLYSDHLQHHENKTAPAPPLIKSIFNLKTSMDTLRFNDDGTILAMSTQREKDGLKLLHVPSQTVFSNWPTSKTPLKYVWSLDFSPQSKFLAIGNDKGKCLLYQLNHFAEARNVNM